jgi:hypothetical protein
MTKCSVVDHDWSRLVEGVSSEDCEVYGRFCSTISQGAKRKRKRNEVGVSCYESFRHFFSFQGRLGKGWVSGWRISIYAGGDQHFTRFNSEARGFEPMITGNTVGYEGARQAIPLLW